MCEISHRAILDGRKTGPSSEADVEAVGVVFAERGRGGDREAELVIAAGAPQARDEAAQLPLAEVGVDVAPCRESGGAVGDDVAADDRAAAAAAVASRRRSASSCRRGPGCRRCLPCRGRSPPGRPSRSWRRGAPRRSCSRAPRSGSGRRRRSRSAAAWRSPCRRRSGTGCAARSCRSRRGRADRRRGWSAGPSRARRAGAGRSAQLAEQDISFWALSGGSPPEPPSPVAK